MTVETAAYIDTLNSSLPNSTDSKSEGDNHIRLVKACLKASFPNISGPVTPTHTRLNALSAHVKAFGATGDGTTDDTAAIQSAINSLSVGGVLEFDGVYNLGTNAGATTLTRLTVATSGITLVFSEKTKFLIKSDAAITQVFTFAGVSNVRTVGTLRVESNASTPYSIYGAYGAKAVVILNANGAACGDIYIDAVHLTRGSGAVFVDNAYASSNRVTGINIGTIETVDATYGFNAQNNGDDVEIGLLRAYGAFRPYFAYGAKNHKATVHAINTYATGTPINITEYSVAEGGSGVHTKNMDFDLLIDGGTPSCCLTVRHIGDGGAAQIISNISVRCAASTLPAVGVEMLNYNTSGGAVSSTVFAATSQNISFETRNPSSAFTNSVSYSTCVWTTKPTVYWYGNGGISSADLAQIVSDNRVLLWRNAFFASSGGLGYDTGFGGTVTQLTSKNTAVSFNKLSGQITMNNAALAANSTTSFTVNNSFATSIADQLVASIYQTVSGTNYNIWTANNGIGQFVVFVRNISAGSLSEAIVLNVALIKGSTS